MAFGIKALNTGNSKVSKAKDKGKPKLSRGEAMREGTKIHKQVEDYVNRGIRSEGVDKVVHPMWAFMRERGYSPVVAEHRIKLPDEKGSKVIDQIFVNRQTKTVRLVELKTLHEYLYDSTKKKHSRFEEEIIEKNKKQLSDYIALYNKYPAQRHPFAMGKCTGGYIYYSSTKRRTFISLEEANAASKY